MNNASKRNWKSLLGISDSVNCPNVAQIPSLQA